MEFMNVEEVEVAEAKAGIEMVRRLILSNAFKQSWILI
jgi:hypothetical protein